MLLDADEYMDSKTIYTPELKPLTQDEFNELSELFAFFLEDEKLVDV